MNDTSATWRETLITNTHVVDLNIKPGYKEVHRGALGDVVRVSLIKTGDMIGLLLGGTGGKKNENKYADETWCS